ncbi:MAG TPA: NTP transferase domain-containing protein [Mucilaginibacter sp.]|nr:NTP transferase domain-containing protein [Mucilaginibacter sp.]
MTSNENKTHKKHTDLSRPSLGSFGRNEWAIVGAPCVTIKLLAGQVIDTLAAKYKCAYVDTAHNDEVVVLPGRLGNGAAMEYTDEINFTQLNYKAPFNSFKLKETFGQADLILANGNHHQAKAQVVIINESKRASLQKRITQLTNVQMILLADGVEDVFDFVKEQVPHWHNIPVYSIAETQKIISFFDSKMQEAKPVLNGLVLAGGKSERMGFDKGSVNWHGSAQRYHMADMLKNFCKDVFISCRADQKTDIQAPYAGLADTFTGLGPYGGILSAFREGPDSAWLVVACDLPLLSKKTLDHLVQNRDVSTIATTFHSPVDEFPEPLITIWEPKSYPVLLSFLAQGYSCPRKVLINSDVNLLSAPYPEELTNVNTPEDLEKVKTILQSNVTAG